MKFTSRPKRAGAALLCLALLTGLLPAGALAAGTGISYIDAEGKEQTRTSATEEVTVNDKEWGGSDSDEHWYVVNGNVPIESLVTVKGNVHLILADECDLTVNGGINVTGTNSLTIYAQSAGDNMGVLTATGTNLQAGIGGGNGGAGGNITINGGTVEATGSDGSAGIGGGFDGAGGNITINGGAVTANGGDSSAGIGGGFDGAGGNITINGGAVTANGGDGGAGIGGGDEGGAGGTITISGGTVKATGGNRGAGIGGGAGYYSGGAGGEITISGGTVKATGGSYGAGIGGGGFGGDNGTFSTEANGRAVIIASSISDNADTNDWSGLIITPTEGEGKIYGDSSFEIENSLEIPAGYKLTIENGQRLTISQGVTLTNNGTITVESGGTLMNNGTIDGSGTIGGSGNVLMNTHYLDTDNASKEVQANLVTTTSTTWTGNDPDGSWYVVNSDIEIGQRVTVTGKVHLILADECNLTVNGGINVTGTNSLTIYAQSTGADMGTLTATGGEGQAGIGGGGDNGSAGGTIAINGGAVIAKGGGNGAGIGGGGGNDTAGIGSTGGAGGEIIINGGTVDATGGDRAAGIGGGSDGAGGKITITGGSVTAKGGGSGGAGIGSGGRGAGGEITITGGTVNATGSGSQYTSGGAGIGGGAGGDAGKITITGGSVTANSGSGAGIGGGENGDNGTFSTGENGRAVIIASSISDSNTTDDWDGVIFQDKTGAVYGTNIAPIEDFTIPEEYELTIEDGQTLTISQGITLTNKGTIIVNDGGALVNQGTITGSGTIQLSGGSTVQTGDGPSITVGEDTTGATAGTDGSVTLPNGGSVVIGSGDDTTTITPPSGQPVTPNDDGSVTIPGGSTVQTGDGPEMALPGGGTIDPDTGAVTPDADGSVTIGSGEDTTTITPPSGQPVTPNGDGSVTIPGGSTVQTGNGPSITVDEDTAGATAGEDGSVTLPNGGSATIGSGDETTTITPPGGGTIKPNGDVVVTVTFDSQGGSQVASQTVAVGTAVARPADPTRSGYSFQGWYTTAEGDTQWDFADSVTGNRTLYARWTQNSSGGGGSTSSPTYPPAIDEPEHGGVTASPSRPKRGDTVTITPDPDAGYEVDEIIVLDQNGNAIAITQNPDGTCTFTQPSGKVTIQVTYRPVQEPEWENPFHDVDEDAWYAGAVRYVQENGLMAGTGPAAFAPHTAASRSMVVTILYRLAGSPDISNENLGYPYADVDADSWYGAAVYWARLTGIAGGYGDGTFGPDDPITREQLALMLYRFAQEQGYDVTASADLSGYTDADQISSYAVYALGWAAAEGIVNGTGGHTLAPQGGADRAQTAAMLMRFCQRYTDTQA